MRGWVVYFANVLRVTLPMPLVAPMKTATNLGGRVEEMRELEAWTIDRETIVNDGLVMLKDILLGIRR